MNYDNTVSLPLTATLNTNNGNNDGFGDGSGWWILLLLLAFSGGFGNNGGGFGGFGGNGGCGMYPWLANGQQEIMNNTNNGFDTLHLSNQIEGVRDGIYGISNSICNSTASVINALNNGFSSTEISANNRQIADMNQNFNNQIATLQGFNGLQSQLAECLKKISKKAKEIFNFTNYKAVGTLVA